MGCQTIKTSQKRDDSIFKQQVSLHYIKAEILDDIYTSNKVQETNNHGEATIPDNHYKSLSGLQVVFRDDIAYCIKVNYIGKSQKAQLEFDPLVLNWFFQKYEDENPERIKLSTETKINSETIIRCHPNYRGNWSWNDYVMIKYCNMALVGRLCRLQTKAESVLKIIIMN